MARWWQKSIPLNRSYFPKKLVSPNTLNLQWRLLLGKLRYPSVRNYHIHHSWEPMWQGYIWLRRRSCEERRMTFLTSRMGRTIPRLPYDPVRTARSSVYVHSADIEAWLKLICPVKRRRPADSWSENSFSKYPYWRWKAPKVRRLSDSSK